jgi:hypothetical protein
MGKGGGMTAKEVEFHCSGADCTEHGHHVEDFLKCEACHQLICHAHSRHAENDSHRFCEACFTCSVCDEPAAVCCEECGALLCHAHAVRQVEQVDDWNWSEPHYYCAAVCQTAVTGASAIHVGTRKAAAVEILEEKRKVV